MLRITLQRSHDLNIWNRMTERHDGVCRRVRDIAEKDY